MTGFAIVIGACTISPISPAAALALLMWTFGPVPSISYEQYRDAYIAAGGTQVAQIERCFAEGDFAEKR